MDITSQLRAILVLHGLSSEETSCYLTLLENGASSALDLSRSSGVPRTSAYRAIDSLIARGLVTEEKRNRRKVYAAQHPRSLLNEARLREQSLTQALPLFEALLFKHPETPATTVFRGRKGFSAAFEAFYDHVQKDRIKQIYSLSHPDLIKKYPKLFAQSVQRRERLKARIYLMRPEQVSHDRSPFLVSNSLRDVRYVPQAFAANTSMLIGGGTVLYISLDSEQPYAILVRSAAISYLLGEFFKVVWSRIALARQSHHS